VFELGDDPQTEITGGFWDDWFFQADLDMTLQNPYGYNFSHVFPNGKSFGIDVAVGKWFSPIVGYRGKFNWENKLPLLKNDHANWLAPFNQPGVNREKGGYIALYGDALINLHNLFGTYRPDRTWNLSLYPRIGVNYNFGVKKGALLAGVGLMNTYRLSKRVSLLGDVAYIMTGGGFVGREADADTGTGSNSNGYLTMGLGVQIELGKVKDHTDVTQDIGKSVMTNGIWDNWFVQAGLDMSLMNPYGCNFSKVIPKGMTFGLNVAAGKWFTPEFALRGRVQWENGLIKNSKVEWVPPVSDPAKNYKGGGFGTFAIDAMLNVTNAIAGYESAKKWHTSAFIRAGIISQFEISSSSPLLGAGLEQTYRLNERLSLFGSLAYQVTTSESSGGSTGLHVPAGTNGFFDIDFGVVYDLGQNGFYRDVQSKREAEVRLAQRHNWSRFIVNTVASVGVGFALKTALKAMIKEERPDHSDNKSFPSGHAAMAFAAARSIDKEFRCESIWIPIAGYAAATAIGVERVASDRHHWYDVVAGAALGFGAAELTWWASDKLFGKGSNIAVGSCGNTVDVVYNF
jgi:hypothetical protein